MSFTPKPHEIYRHFKGSLYQIIAVAEHSETGEQLVVYQAMYGDFKIYARPLEMFTGRVDRDKYPDSSQEFRFELQGPDNGRQKAESAQEAETAANLWVSGKPPEDISDGQDLAEASGGGVRRPAGGVQPEHEEVSGTTEDMYAEGCAEEPALDPMVLEFLDADSYEARLNILTGLHHRVTDDMLTTLAIACDVEIGQGETEERYESLKNCLLTLERYECNRIR